MGFLNENANKFTDALKQVDEVLEQDRPVDMKTDELLRFALSIKARSAPCVRKHYRGSLAAGATEQELAWVFALTMREAAGADDCWTHSVISDLVETQPGASCGGGCS
jgi:AhpD family alkylhydroperoxidase